MTDAISSLNFHNAYKKDIYKVLYKIWFGGLIGLTFGVTKNGSFFHRQSHEVIVFRAVAGAVMRSGDSLQGVSLY